MEQAVGLKCHLAGVGDCQHGYVPVWPEPTWLEPRPPSDRDGPRELLGPHLSSNLVCHRNDRNVADKCRGQEWPRVDDIEDDVIPALANGFVETARGTV